MMHMILMMTMILIVTLIAVMRIVTMMIMTMLIMMIENGILTKCIVNFFLKLFTFKSF